VFGNTKTRDEVIRREFRQLEGAWFDSNKITKSKQRADRLGFFSEVALETPAVQGAPDQMDINVTVKEKSTGSFTIGGGINSGEGLVLMGGVTQANLFGSGNHLSTQVNTGKINQVVSLSFTNPYYTDDGVSRGFDIYKRKVNAINTTLSQYTSSTLGGGVRFSVPIDEDEGITYGLSAESTTLGLTANSPLRYVNFINTFGATNKTVSGTAGWYHDTRNSAIDTTAGLVQRLNLEVALPVFNMRYVKASYDHQWFYPLADHVTFMFNGQVGAATGYNGKQLPFFKNLYAGGVGSVRGYETNSLGPRDINNYALGGTRRVVASSEVIIPFPGMAKDTSIRLSGFVDSGAVYGSGDLPGTVGMRYSTGVAVTWMSPMGPFKFSYGIPLNKQANDKLQKFQFTLGTIF
jgi:outer membrane protein insertion porin family